MIEANNIIRIATNSIPKDAAGSIAKRVRLYGEATVQAIGAAAVNQAVKSIIVASDYLEAEQVRIVTVMEFIVIEIEAEQRTAIRFCVRKVESSIWEQFSEVQS